MEKLIFDDGLLELEVNGNGILRFRPTDINLYYRFCELSKKLPELEKEYAEQEKADLISGKENDVDYVLSQMHKIDQTVKEELAKVFGPENDFDALLDGVNLMSVARNGERIVTNFLNAIRPYIENGAKKYMQDSAADAVAAAKKERAKRTK